jgi:hypothetical protein
VLPAVKYRLVKDFDLEIYSPEGLREIIAEEFAIVEFTVPETLSSEDYFIEMLKNMSDD